MKHFKVSRVKNGWLIEPGKYREGCETGDVLVAQTQEALLVLIEKITDRSDDD